MKILLAIDGSAHSDVAIAEVARRPWPRDTEVLVITVVHAAAPFLPDPSLVLAAAHAQQIQQGYDHAAALVTSACEQLRRSVPSLNVQTTVDEGVPKDAIVDATRR